MLKVSTLLAVLLSSAGTAATANGSTGLVYSGKTTWESTTGSVTFESSGTMPDTKEGFYWDVPAEVRRIEIGAEVTVRGAFRISFRSPANPLWIVGKDRRTSVIFGTDMEEWTTKNNIADHDKWKYGAVNVVADAVVHVTNLTSQNPRGYNISGYANKAVLHVSRCNLIDSRKGHNNNSDGFIGAAGSTIMDSFISTSDDGIKVYHDMTIRNVTIEQHRNGAPIQFGWGGESGHAKAIIENLTIKGVDEQQRYNMAPFTWQGGTTGTREVTITGLKVYLAGKLYDEKIKGWRPIGLFKLRPKGCTLNFTVVDGDVGGLPLGTRETQGVIKMDGVTL
jgi:hypothetical protein